MLLRRRGRRRRMDRRGRQLRRGTCAAGRRTTGAGTAASTLMHFDVGIWRRAADNRRTAGPAVLLHAGKRMIALIGHGVAGNDFPALARRRVAGRGAAGTADVMALRRDRSYRCTGMRSNTGTAPAPSFESALAKGALS